MHLWVQLVFGAVTAIVTAGLAFTGAVLGQRLDYRRWHREETMRLLRWAADKALDPDDAVGEAGIGALFALLDAALLQTEDEDFVRHITARIASARLPQYPEVEIRLRQEGPNSE